MNNHSKTWWLRAAIRAVRLYGKRRIKPLGRLKKEFIIYMLENPFAKDNAPILKQALKRINQGKTIKLP